jgi:hypothetical protein
MEKKWDTVTTADLKRLFVSGIICPAGHERVNKSVGYGGVMYKDV